MVYEPISTTNAQGETVLHRPLTWEDVIMRPLVGVTLLAIGGLVIYVFLTGGGLKPFGTGWRWVGRAAVAALFFTALGVIPAVGGISALARTDRLVIRPASRQLEHQIRVAGCGIWRRPYSFDRFDGLRNNPCRRGPFGGSQVYEVVAEGGGRSVILAVYSNPHSAEQLSGSLAVLMNLPLRSEK